jgi:FtsP/CotA-like multicopper oxidase with cupredoxin domain
VIAFAAAELPSLFPRHGTMVIRIPFQDFAGRFVYQCHILAHEDGGMMGVVAVGTEAG